MKSQRAVARMGGHARTAACSPERRRAIATAAQIEAMRRRHGLITVRQAAELYIANLKADDSDMGRFVELAFKLTKACAPMTDDELLTASRALGELLDIEEKVETQVPWLM